MSFICSSIQKLRLGVGSPTSCKMKSVTFRCLNRYKYSKTTNLKWSSKDRVIRNGITVTTASAATCTLLYLSMKPTEHELLWRDLNCCWKRLRNKYNLMIKKIEDSISAFEDDGNILDLVFNIGYVDEWLACPFLHRAFHSEKVYESSAFVKPNIVELLSPWEQSSSDDPWVLLHLTKSGNFWVRQMGVACLANKVDWEAYKYRNVAQACDYKTVIGLARYDQASDAFFFPQPKLCPLSNDVLSEVQKLLTSMPTPDSLQSSIAYYRSLALENDTRYQEDPLAMDVLQNFYTLPGEEEKKIDQLLRYCLQALEAYTAEDQYACLFVKQQGLAVLQRLHEEFSEDWVKTYVLSILNNLSQVAELGKAFVQSGWIHELRKWCKGSNTTFSVLADTVLANLDRDWIFSDLYKNMILLHPTQRNSLPVNADIVLVHGLGGGAVKTWRQKADDDDIVEEEVTDSNECSDCWPKDWMSSELQTTRIISIGYNSTLHQWGDQYPYDAERQTLEGRSKELMEHLTKAGVGTRPIIWMGHSMGGLLIKQMLVLAEKTPTFKKLLNNTKGIVMYSVPHRGSHLVDTMMYAKYLLFPSIEVQEMSTYSPKLKDLHDNFVHLVSSCFIPCLSFGESIKTELGRPFPSVLLVGEDSSDPGIGQFFTLAANHIDVCKPTDKEDPMYLHTLHFLKNILKNLQQ